MTNGKALPGRINAYNPEAGSSCWPASRLNAPMSHFNHLRKINKFPILQDMSADEFFSLGLRVGLWPGAANRCLPGTNASISASIIVRHCIYKAVFGNRFLMVHNGGPVAATARHDGADIPSYRGRADQQRPVQPAQYSHRGDGEGLPLSPTTIDRLNKVLGANYAAFRELAGSSGRNAAPARERRLSQLRPHR